MEGKDENLLITFKSGLLGGHLDATAMHVLFMYIYIMNGFL
jgi:hypothetical protein